MQEKWISEYGPTLKYHGLIGVCIPVMSTLDCSDLYPGFRKIGY